MANRLPPNGYILGLDVGDKRIGVAISSVIARLPQPLKEILVSNNVYAQISEVVEKNQIKLIVIGLPRNLEGQETAQSQKIRQFTTDLTKVVDAPIEFADESLSSRRAQELAKNTNFKNVSTDSLAACFILEEYLGTIDISNQESI